MKTEPLSISERIQAFTHELALSLRRIAGREVELDLPPVVKPVENQDEPITGVDAKDEE